jgi:tRNA 2-selenouridine synthase SelU
MAAFPERRFGPALLQVVPKHQVTTVRGGDAGNRFSVSAHRFLIDTKVGAGSFGGGQAGEERVEDALRREWIERQGRVAGGEKAVAGAGIEVALWALVNPAVIPAEKPDSTDGRR